MSNDGMLPDLGLPNDSTADPAMKRPAYFDSQASAAAVLGISIDNIRQAKAAGCRAFRSGRVYGDELVAWLEEQRRLRTANPNRDPRIDRTTPVAKTII